MMLKRNWKKVLRSRKTAWILLVCLMAGAVSGTVYKNSRQGKDIESEAQQAAADEEERLQALGEADAGEENGENTGETDSREDNSEKIQAAAETKQENADENDEAEEGKEETADAAPASALVKTDSLDFLTKNELSWPVQGEVLLEFNMDNTIYFPTLNQYKCSQAMVIQAEQGTPVCAPAEGIVLSIGTDEQIGNYLVLDMGDGYQTKLGQLKDIEVSEGVQVQEGDLLAYIAAPTKCYSVEGDNLYLELTENGTPVDPLDYLN
ncbi:MAG: peptidoglycan DD-metalloendopeptidase family protein [Lachnospiraceae bacterium]|nr:peptidoglycan DD-metalloendopeptidase family protein [Lachnospiraceae bacterium]